jgi:uncharacterized NAD(P)/FAD-binding protein YdhS
MALTLAIVGCGVAGGAFVVELAEAIYRQQRPTTIDEVVIFEPQKCLGRGVPYAHNAGEQILTITPIHGVLPERLLEEFSSFLATLPRGHWFLRWSERGGGGTRPVGNALSHDPSLEPNIADRHLPRKIVGEFLSSRVDNARKTLKKVGIATRHIRAAVEKIEIRDGGVLISTEQGSYCAGRLLLSIGSIAAGPPISCDDAYSGTLIENYSVNPDALQERISELEEGSSVVILGSNASTVEVLYLAETAFANARCDLFVLSPSGTLPSPLVGGRPVATTLVGPLKVIAQTEEAARMSAPLLGIAADLEQGRMQLAVAKVSDLAAVLPDCSEAERVFMVNTVMPLVVRALRRTEGPYAAVLAKLRSSEHVKIVAGKLTSLRSGPVRGRTLVDYVTQENVSDILDADLVINCTDRGCYRDATNLVDQLRRDHPRIISINTNGRGITVDDRFQATENIYVFGPLLAGLALPTRQIWHLESTKGIFQLAPDVCSAVMQGSAP